MLGNLLGPEISELIETRNFGAIRGLFEGMPAADIGEIISEIAEENQAIVFRLLPQSNATEVLEYLAPDEQERIIRNLGNEEAARILNDMSDDDRTALLEELPAAIVTQLLTLLSPKEQQVARTLLGYPEGSVGRLMTTEFLTVRPDWTIGQSLEHIRTHGNDSETLNVIYVTDGSGRLIDDVYIREFLVRPLEAKVDTIHDNRFLALRATDTQEVALSLFKKYDRNTLPVVDSSDMLLGIVTVDDMLDIQDEATTEDIQKIGGMEALDTPYMETPMVQPKTTSPRPGLMERMPAIAKHRKTTRTPAVRTMVRPPRRRMQQPVTMLQNRRMTPTVEVPMVALRPKKKPLRRSPRRPKLRPDSFLWTPTRLWPTHRVTPALWW